MKSNNHEIKIIFDQWYHAIRSAQAGHGVAAVHYQMLHRIVGFLVVGLTSGVGVLTFYNPNGQLAEEFQLIKSILSVFAVVMASVQTFFNYSELSQKHGNFSTKYRMLRKELDQIFAINGLSNQSIDFMDDFRKRWDNIDQDAPTLTEYFFRKANKVMNFKSGILSFTEEIEQKIHRNSLDAKREMP